MGERSPEGLTQTEMAKAATGTNSLDGMSGQQIIVQSGRGIKVPATDHKLVHGRIVFLDVLWAKL